MIVLGIAASIVSFASTSDSKGIKVLKAFSMYDNFKKIVTISQPENENLVFLNGMRVFSICWVILGHDEWFRFMNIKNWVQALSILTTPGLTTLAFSAYFAVDVFFWIGGFLLTITLAEKMVTMKKVNILLCSFQLVFSLGLSCIGLLEYGRLIWLPFCSFGSWLLYCSVDPSGHISQKSLRLVTTEEFCGMCSSSITSEITDPQARITVLGGAGIFQSISNSSLSPHSSSTLTPRTKSSGS